MSRCLTPLREMRQGGVNNKINHVHSHEYLGTQISYIFSIKTSKKMSDYFLPATTHKLAMDTFPSWRTGVDSDENIQSHFPFYRFECRPGAVCHAAHNSHCTGGHVLMMHTHAPLISRNPDRVLSCTLAHRIRGHLYILGLFFSRTSSFTAKSQHRCYYL